MTARWQDISEADWQEQVTDLLRIGGWEWLHVRRSLGKRGGQTAWQTTTNISGWPDLYAFHPEWQRHCAIELKAKYNKPTDDQIAVLTSLYRSGVEAHVWWPKDLDEATAILCRRNQIHPMRSGF